MSGQVTNTGSFNGEISTVAGAFTNNSGLTLTGGTLGGGLVNDGIAKVASPAHVTIENYLRGTGSFLNEGSLTLAHSAVPSAPFNLGMEITSTNNIQTPDGYTGGPIDASGSFSGGIGGTLNVLTGQSLSLAGQVWTTGLVNASGEDTSLRVATGWGVTASLEDQDHNAGRIVVSDGAELRTSTSPFYNDATGRIELSNADFVLEMPYSTSSTIGQTFRFTNNGVITLDRSTMDFRASSHGWVWWRKYIDGEGRIELRNFSTMVDPFIEGGTQELDVDSTSSIIVTDNRYSGSLMPERTIEGTLINAGQVTARQKLRIAGSLVNDGTIDIASSKTILDVPQISGTGSISVTNNAQLNLDNSAHPGEPVLIKQPVTVNGGSLTTEQGVEFRTEGDGVVKITGQISGQIGGRVEQLPGDHLSMSGTVTPTGRITAAGADKLLLWDGTNKGQIELSNGATLKTTGNQNNVGTIKLTNGAVFESRGRSAKLTNDGVIHLDKSRMNIAWELYNYHFYSHYLDGTGKIELTNGSELHDPDIRGSQTVDVDATSSIVFTSGQYDYHLGGHVESEGLFDCQNNPKITLGSWHMAGGKFQAPKGAKLTFTGDWTIEPGAVDFDFANLYVTFDGGSEDDPLFITAAGEDLGKGSDAWDNNFVISSLTIANNGYLALADPGSSTREDLAPASIYGALYVENLYLEPDAVLNTNGFALYYDQLVGDTSQIVNNPVPIPSSLILMASGCLLMAVRILRRRSHSL